MRRNTFASQSIRVGLAVFAAVVLAVMIGGCGHAGAGDAGNLQTETRDVRGFDSAEFAGVGTLIIEQTGTESLEIQADKDVLPSLTSAVSGTTLQLGVEPGVEVENANAITYRLTVEQLKGIFVSGAGQVTVTKLDEPALSVAHRGAGRVTVSGRVTSQAVDLSGFGEYDASNLESQNADVTVSGTGKVVVDASRTLHARVTGVGGVEYLGNPALTEEITGVGQITKR